MNEPTFDDILAARARIAPHAIRTLMLRNAELDRVTGATVLIKPECLQHTGSFKMRGAANAVARLDGPSDRAVVAFSSGNHGQAVAAAAQAAGRRATIVMPADAPRAKVAGVLRWGAEIVRYDRATENRDAIAGALAERSGAALIPPFDHPDVIAGQGTLALELAEDAAAAGFALDDMLVCTGGGGMVAGCALALRGISPATRVHAVEPAGNDDTARSLVAGERLSNAPGGSTLCDAVVPPRPGELTFSINRRLLTDGLVVSDDEALAAMAFAFAHLKLVVEPGGAVALAAVLSGKLDTRGRVIGVVLSGGNVDADIFQRALSTLG